MGMEGIENLLQNKLFLQYISAAGAGLAEGGGAGMAQAVGGVTQQNIATQNYSKMQQQQMKMLSEILRGELPAGASVKKSPDGKSTFSLPSMDGLRSEEAETVFPGGAKPLSGSAYGGGLLNPSDDQPGTSGPDLAGLTPQDLSRALSGAVNVNQLVQTSDILRQKVDVARQNAGQTDDIKEYHYAISQGYDGSLSDFMNNTKSLGIKDYEYAKDQGYKGSLYDWKTQIAKFGATRINMSEKVETKKRLGEIKGQLRFDSGDFSGDIEKHMSSKDVTQRIFLSDTENESLAKSEEKANFISSQLIGNGAEIIDEKLKDKIGTWQVKWPNGEVKSYSYVLYD